MKAKIDNACIFTVRDALKFCKVYKWVSYQSPELDKNLTGILDKSYSVSNVLTARTVIMYHLSLLTTELAAQFPNFEYLPMSVIGSHATMDLLLSDPTALQPVIDQKLTFDGLVMLCEKGRI